MTFGHKGFSIILFTTIEFTRVSHMLGMWLITFCNELYYAYLHMCIIAHVHSVLAIMPAYL